MIEHFTEARPYAKAIFALAVEQNKLQEWGQFLEMLAITVTDPAASKFLSNPKISFDAQFDFLQSIYIFPQLNAAAKHLIANLLQMLVRRRRLVLAPIISNLYKQSLHEYEGILPVKIKLAFDLNEAEKRKIISVLQKKWQFAIQAEFSVDPELIGGMVIYLQDKVIDGSVLGGLKRLRAEMTR